ncbi:13750_t:CDS:2 [Entrophospora sp. SA101]|nr:13750_t:CDS:2 [Entrophospora sp. SA101]CAJ0826837.1 3857_t:CDS:2 [Entrophospora sp. SA101]
MNDTDLVQMAVKRVHLIGSTNLYREAAENNAQEIISEGFSNVFVKHPLENDSISKTSPPAKKTHILEWRFLNDEKAIADEWIIDNHSITKSFLDFMNMTISLANEEQSYYKLKVKSDDPGKKLLRKCQNVWKHLCENWKTSFDDNRTVEDTCVHELLHPFLKPFFTIEQGHDINW